jgi:hypothetical protein
MAADVSAIAFFAPIAAFLLVFLVSYAVLMKTKIIGEGRWVLLFVSFLIASIFVASGGVLDFVQTFVPWVAVLLISLFFIMMLIFFMGKEVSFLQKPIGVLVIVALGIIFIVSAFGVFNDVLIGYLPGPGFGSTGDAGALSLLDWIYSPRVSGAILLIVISAGVAWVLVKAKK